MSVDQLFLYAVMTICCTVLLAFPIILLVEPFISSQLNIVKTTTYGGNTTYKIQCSKCFFIYQKLFWEMSFYTYEEAKKEINYIKINSCKTIELVD